MRILLLHHHWHAASPASAQCTGIVRDLAALGHDVRILTLGSAADECPAGRDCHLFVTMHELDDTGSVRLAGPPRFADEPGTGPTFDLLSTDDLLAYRIQLRRLLDRQVVAFDPHLIHAQHLWVWAQLALETGAPYCVSVWPQELAESASRYLELAQQAYENSARLFVDVPEHRLQLHSRFGDSEAPVETLPAPTELAQIYADAVRQRLGPDVALG